MAYDPGVHHRLEALSEKYRAWYMSRSRQPHGTGLPVINADGIESSLSDCYEDAMVTAHALYVYLMENPPVRQPARHETVQQHVPPPVDVLGEADRHLHW